MTTAKLPPLARLTSNLSGYISCPLNDWHRIKAVKEGIPGWSQPAHYLFYRELLRGRPDAEVLITGVYHGLDLAYMTAAAEDLGQTVRLTGVDLFADAPIKDWEVLSKIRGEEIKGQTWKEATGNEPPNMEAAKKNCPSALLIKGDSVAFMEQCPVKFDIIYLDSSHDFDTVSREIRAARPLLKEGGILCGDDYSCNGWMVYEAVQAELPEHIVFFDRIWAATL